MFTMLVNIGLLGIKKYFDKPYYCLTTMFFFVLIGFSNESKDCFKRFNFFQKNES